jgi:PAS domain S-box-containing protein
VTRPRVLVVEDNQITRRMFRVALESEGWSVLEAGDARTAIEAVTRERPDVVLQDLTIPDMDGLELVKRLLEIPGRSDLRVIAMSGFLSKLEQAGTLALGFVEHLFKPIDPDRLIEVVRSHLTPRAIGTAGAGRRVLLVDNDAVQCRLLRLQLESVGFVVSTASGGVEALERVALAKPDAIVSDVLMPGMCGLRLCYTLRSDPALVNVPVVLVSIGFTEPSDRELARSLGASALVARTPDHAAVLDALLASLAGGPPPLPAPGIEPPTDEFTHRVVRQLERQVGKSADLAGRLALHEAAMGLLARIGETVRSPAALGELLPELLNHALDAAGISIGAVFLIEPDSRLVLSAWHGFSDDRSLAAFFGHDTVLKRAADRLETINVPLAEGEEPWERELLARAGARSLLLLPLRLGEERLGVLVLAAARQRLMGEWVPFAEAMGVQISQSVALARAVARIQSEQERFRALADSMPQIVWSARGDGMPDYYNERWYAFSGVARGSDPLVAWRAVIHPDDVVATEESRRRSLETGTPWEVEYRLRSASDGEYRWHLGRALPIRDSSGAVVRWNGTATDIDDRKRVEKDLKESEEKLRQIAENIHEVFWMTDRQITRLMYVSPAYEAVWGQPRESAFALPRTLGDAIHEDDRERVLGEVLDRHARGEAYEVSYRIVRPGGALRWIRNRAAPVRDASGTVTRYVGVASDVTDLTLALEAQVRQARLTAFSAEVAVAVAQTEDQREALRKCTDAAVRHLDASLARIWQLDSERNALVLHASSGLLTTGEGPSQIVPVGSGRIGRIAQSREPLLQNDLAADPRLGDLGWFEREGFVAFAGHPLVVEARVVGVMAIFARKPLDGSTIKALAAAADVVAVGLERKRHERETAALELQLRRAQKMEAIGRLAGGVAHDFNNVLTAIMGYSELALGHLDAPDQLRRDLTEIRMAGERAASLTRQLLVFSRHEAIVPQILDPNEVIRGMENMLRRLIGEDVDLRLALDPDAGRVKIDKGYLEQVVLNLCVNARDAMPRGGTLKIATANVDLVPGAGVAADSGAGPHVSLSVSDTGVGMTAEVLMHLFEPFFTTKEEGKGTGLGLSTVYGIVRGAGGQVSVDSELGGGSSFRLSFPRALEPISVAPAPVEPKRGGDGTETILLVEDNEFVRILANHVLETSGYEVLVAADGAEALAISERRKQSIQLVLTDVIMPGMSGPELVERLVAARPGLRVLFFSGYTSGAIQQADAAGSGSAFLQKPFTPKELVLKVREVLDAAR